MDQISCWLFRYMTILYRIHDITLQTVRQAWKAWKARNNHCTVKRRWKCGEITVKNAMWSTVRNYCDGETLQWRWHWETVTVTVRDSERRWEAVREGEKRWKTVRDGKRRWEMRDGERQWETVMWKTVRDGFHRTFIAFSPTSYYHHRTCTSQYFHGNLSQ